MKRNTESFVASARRAINLPGTKEREVSSFQKGRDKRCAAGTTDYYTFAYENPQFVPIKLTPPLLVWRFVFK